MNHFQKTLLLVALLLLATASEAQVRYGVRAGLGLNKVTPRELPTGDLSFKNIIGPTVGAMATFTTNDWVDLQLELNYSMRGYKDDVVLMAEPGYDRQGSYKVRSHYLEVPLLAKVFPVKSLELNLQAGPQFGLLLNRSVSVSSKQMPTDGLLADDSKADAALVFGLGYDNGRISVDTRYTLGLTKTFKDWPGHKNRGLSISVGYYF